MQESGNRFNRTVRYDWLAQDIFETIEEVQDKATNWMWHYNNERPNMSKERKLTTVSNEKMARIVAPVPYSLKKELRRYVVDHPNKTEKSLILKGLRTLGFSVADEYIEDKRKNKHD